jgi:hypothetical protein
VPPILYAVKSKALSLEEEEELRWMKRVEQFIEEIRATDIAVCGSCGKSLKNPDGSLNVRMRNTYDRGYKVRQLFCTNCGEMLIEQEPKVKPPRVSLMQEVEALAPPRGSGFDMVSNKPRAPLSLLERLEEGEDDSIASLFEDWSDEEALFFVKTCGSCPHLKNGRCDVPEKSGRKCRIKRQYPICKWWEAERWLIAVKTGEIRLSDDYEYVFRHFENLKKKKLQ